MADHGISEGKEPALQIPLRGREASGSLSRGKERLSPRTEKPETVREREIDVSGGNGKRCCFYTTKKEEEMVTKLVLDGNKVDRGLTSTDKRKTLPKKGNLRTFLPVDQQNNELKGGCPYSVRSTRRRREVGASSPTDES